MLPEVRDSSAIYGETATGLFDRAIPIGGIAGDQQAALIGQACFEPGMVKSTYGTGCFLLLNTGDTPVLSRNRMLTTPAYRINGRTTYAMEGSIFVAGAAIKWLRDGLRIINDAAETAALAMRVPDSHGVYLVPAFVGLGAPHWVPSARGLICGLTLDATGAHLARAALESVAFQTLDLTAAMAGDGAQGAAAIRVDGGMAANDWFCRFLADVLDARVEETDPARDDGARGGVPGRACDAGSGPTCRPSPRPGRPAPVSRRAWRPPGARNWSQAGKLREFRPDIGRLIRFAGALRGTVKMGRLCRSRMYDYYNRCQWHRVAAPRI